MEYDLAEVRRFDDDGQQFLDLAIDLADADTGDDDADSRLDRLDLFEPGVYPLTVQIRIDQRVVASHTTFIGVLDTSRFGRGPMRFALFATVPDPGPTPTDRDLADARAQIERIIETASAVEAPLTLSLPPTVVTSLSATDPALIDELRLAVSNGDVLLALPDFELDPSSAVAAGLTEELTRRFVVGEGQLGTAFPAVSVDRAAWAVDGALTPSGADALRDLGIPLLIVTESRYGTYEGNIGGFIDTTLMSNAALPDGSPIRIAIVDPVGELFASSDPGGRSPIDRAVRAMATADAIRFGVEPALRSIVIAAPGMTVPDADTVAWLERFVDEHPDFSFETLSRLPNDTNNLFIDDEAHTVRLPELVPVDLGPRVDRANVSRLGIADVASMLPDDDSRPNEWENDLDLAMSTGLTSVEATSIIDDVDADLADLRAAVHPPETFPLTIASREADIPIRIENTSTTTLTVVVRLRSDKLAVPGGDITAELPPGELTEIPVPVVTRSNGVFPVTVEVLTPAGNPLADPVELTARVNNLTGLGRVVTVGAALVLISWWFSYFRRRRKQQVDRSADRHPAGGTSTSTAVDQRTHPAAPTVNGSSAAHDAAAEVAADPVASTTAAAEATERAVQAPPDEAHE